MDQRSIEDLFERNADMRLLEFRHNEPGKGAPANKRTASSFGAESIMSTTPDIEMEDAPQLRVGIGAAPSTGVIPGAVVGVAIDVFNDGTAPAPESKLLLAIPIETQYRTGTLRIDGREPQAPEQLFAQGLPVPRLPGGTSSKVTFQLAILPGVNMLYLQPRLQAEGVPVVGTAGISIKRGSSSAAAVAPEPPKPFYELEPEEIAEVAAQSAEPIMPPVVEREPTPEPDPIIAAPEPEAIVAAPEPAATIAAPEPAAIIAAPEPEAIIAVPEPEAIVATPEPEAIIAAPEPAPIIAAPAPQPIAAAPVPEAIIAAPEPEPIAPAPTIVPQPEPVAAAPLPLPLAPERDPELVLEPAPKTKAAAPKRMRKSTPTPEPEIAPTPAPRAKPAKATAAAPTDARMVCFRSLGPSDTALLDRLFSAESPGLIAHHVLISSIACSEPASGEDVGGYSAFLKRDIELLGRALVHSRMGKATSYKIAQSDLDGLSLTWAETPAPTFPAPRRLRRNLRRTEWTAIGGLMQTSERDATLRARIALLALAAETVDGVDGKTADECTAALAAYRSAVLAWLVPLCVASAGHANYEIPAPPASVDTAGRNLVGVLRSTLSA